MSRYSVGEYMPLNWEGRPDAYYVMGHIGNEAGKDIIINEACLDEVEAENLGQAEHIYGRWSMEPGEDGNQHFLRECKGPGKGRFPITMFGVGVFAKKAQEGGE